MKTEYKDLQITNFMAATHSEKAGTGGKKINKKLTKAHQTPVWIIPQVSRITMGTGGCNDWV